MLAQPFPDFESAGGKVVDKKTAFQSDIVLKVRAPSKEETGLFRDQGTLYSFLYPAQNKDLVEALAKHNLTVFGMDCVPRISRAQVFDALSSMANIAGYRWLFACLICLLLINLYFKFWLFK